MKMRWRLYEQIFVLIFAVIATTHGIWQQVKLITEEYQQPVQLYSQLVLLQLTTSILQLICYFWLHRLTIKLFKRNSAPAFVYAVRYLWIAIQWLTVAYLLGPVCNFLPFYYNVAYIHLYAVHSILPPHPQPFENTFGGYNMALIATVIYFIYAAVREGIMRYIELTQAMLSRSQADMQLLRSQINPHFLFNTLNTLYGTAIEDGSKRTAQGIQMLGDMMRFMLHENHLDTIALNKETDYMQHYIALQKLRIQSSPDIRIETHIATNCTHQIAPMLLIPLVENAFKHGISLQQPSWINISLACNTDSLQFIVRNSIHSLNTHDTEKHQSGIGLQNVTERLKLLYSGRYFFQATTQGDEFTATLHLNFLTTNN